VASDNNALSTPAHIRRHWRHVIHSAVLIHAVLRTMLANRFKCYHNMTSKQVCMYTSMLLINKAIVVLISKNKLLIFTTDQHRRKQVRSNCFQSRHSGMALSCSHLIRLARSSSRQFALDQNVVFVHPVLQRGSKHSRLRPVTW
jgi:hypothetical protein